MEIFVINVRPKGSQQNPKRNSEANISGEENDETSVTNEIQNIGNIDTTNSMASKQRANSNHAFVVKLLDKEENNARNDGQPNNGSQVESSTSIRALFRQTYIHFMNNINRRLEVNSQLSGLLGIFIILSISVFTLIITCWPAHNVLLYPEYWYEQIIPVQCVYGFSSPLFFFIDVQLLLKAKEILTLRSLGIYYFLSVLGNVLLHVLMTIFWVKYLNFQFPLVHATAVFGLVNTFILSPLQTWIIFPKELKAKNDL